MVPFQSETRWEAQLKRMLDDEKPEDAHLEVWPESHWPGFALRQADVFQSYTAW